MFIEETKNQEKPDEMKEIKVKIPTEYHWKLHTLKLTSGVHISQVVRHALGDYFGEVFDADDADGE